MLIYVNMKNTVKKSPRVIFLYMPRKLFSMDLQPPTEVAVCAQTQTFCTSLMLSLWVITKTVNTSWATTAGNPLNSPLPGTVQQASLRKKSNYRYKFIQCFGSCIFDKSTSIKTNIWFCIAFKLLFFSVAYEMNDAWMYYNVGATIILIKC